MDVDGKGSSWRHCCKGVEHVTHVALFTFSTAMLLALFHFIFSTPHTQYRYTLTSGHTQTHMDTDMVPLSHFALFVTYMRAKDTNFIFGMPQIYTCTDTPTHAHICGDTSTCRDRHMYTDTHAYFFTHTNTHTYMSGQFCLLILYLVAICRVGSGPHGPTFKVWDI